MSEFKGTKGKWILENNGVISVKYPVRTIAVVNGSLSNIAEDKANALLMSKSPQMLKELKESLEVIKWYMENTIPDNNNESFFNIGMNQRVSL